MTPLSGAGERERLVQLLDAWRNQPGVTVDPAKWSEKFADYLLSHQVGVLSSEPEETRRVHEILDRPLSSGAPRQPSEEEPKPLTVDVLWGIIDSECYSHDVGPNEVSHALPQREPDAESYRWWEVPETELPIIVERINRFRAATPPGAARQGEGEAFAWLHERVAAGEGAYAFGITENGDIGLFREGQPKSIGVGDTAYEALTAAIRALPSKEEG
jgi:hypothetical protein